MLASCRRFDAGWVGITSPFLADGSGTHLDPCREGSGNSGPYCKRLAICRPSRIYLLKCVLVVSPESVLRRIGMSFLLAVIQ